MCGVFGFSGPDSGRSVAASLAACAHRGPDGSVVFSPADRNPHQFALGHALLSVRGDTAAAAQPVLSGDGRLALAFNGELYHPPGAAEDGPAFLAALAGGGVEALSDRVDAMYSLALWDRDAGTVLLARDRTGARPLYYAVVGDRLLFASEIRGIAAAGVDVRLDPVGVRLYLQFGHVPGPRTLVKGVSKLAPGEWRLYALPGRLLKTGTTVKSPPATEFCPAAYRDALVKAVGRCLPTVKKSGLLLSGGLDSAAVLWAMAELGHRANTLTTRYAGDTDPASDAEVAVDLARFFGARHNEVVFHEAAYPGATDAAVAWCDEVTAGKGMGVYLTTFRAAADLGWTVVFTGDGGDELLGGYPRHAYVGPGDPVAGWVNLTGRDRAAGVVRCPEAAELDVVDYMRGWLPRAALGGDPLQAHLAIESVCHLPEEYLIRNDKLGMSVGLESRHPLLHDPFRSYAAGLPSSARTLSHKYPVTSALRGLLPAAVLDRPKSGWGPPLGKWIGGKGSLSGKTGKRIRKVVTPGFSAAVDEVVDVAAVNREGSIKLTLACYYLSLWANKVVTK